MRAASPSFVRQTVTVVNAIRRLGWMTLLTVPKRRYDSIMAALYLARITYRPILVLAARLLSNGDELIQLHTSRQANAMYARIF